MSKANLGHKLIFHGAMQFEVSDGFRFRVIYDTSVTHVLIQDSSTVCVYGTLSKKQIKGLKINFI
jgi:hypothetical protein